MPAQQYKLSILVRDGSSAEPLPLANVQVDPGAKGGTTDENGRMSLALPAGYYTVVGTYVGYQDDTVRVRLFKDQSITLGLLSQEYLLEGVTVTGYDARENIERPQMGLQHLSTKQITVLPTAIGEVDVLRSLTMLPGIGSAGEASNGLSVRGGSLDQNLVLLDHAPIFNPTHLFGLFSVFTPEAVGGIDVFRANMPARFGGRIASVVDVRMRSPDAPRFNLNGGIGLVSSRIGIETPLIKNKLSVVAAGRASFNEFLFPLIKRLKNTRANFQDATVKFKYQLNERNLLTLTGFYSKDFYQVDIVSTFNNITSNQNQYDYYTLNGTLSWLKALENGGSLKTNFVRSEYQPKILFPLETGPAIIYSSGIRYYSADTEYDRKINENWTVSTGAQAMHYNLQPGALDPGGATGLAAATLPNEKSIELSAFGETEWTPNEKLTLSAGLRYSQYLQIGPIEVANYSDEVKEEITGFETISAGKVAQTYGGPEPRVGLRYQVSETSSIKASYALTRQYLQNIYNSTTPLPTSRWKASDRHIRPQVGQSYSLGYYQNLKEGKVEFSIEGYFRHIENILDYKSGADFFLERFVEQDVLQGTGRTYGVELSFTKPTGRVNGWLNYTYSRSFNLVLADALRNRINNNEWYPSNFDRPHVLNATVNLEPNQFNVFSFNFTMQSGRPYTAANWSFKLDEIYVPIFIERNNARLPMYHRLDFSWRVHNITTREGKRWVGDWIFTIYNILGRKNAFNKYYGPNPGNLGYIFGESRLGAYQLSIFGTPLVSLGYNFTFK